VADPGGRLSASYSTASPVNAAVPDADVKALVKWVLSVK
jgi:hypothetical protein